MPCKGSCNFLQAIPRVVLSVNSRFFVFLLLLSALASPAFSSEVSLKVLNPSDKDRLVFMLFDSANTFGDLREPVFTKEYTPREDGFYLLEEIPVGEYALVVFSDENGNRSLDKNFIGIPKEPLAFSNQYKPKGPPSFSRAAFLLPKGEKRHFNLKLERPLGDFGRFGVGVGIISRSNPYTGAAGTVTKSIPAITYTGERVQIYGPSLQIGVISRDAIRLALSGKYRIGAYEEDDSTFLDGMGDRNDTVMAGLLMTLPLSKGIDLNLGYHHDVLGETGGGIATVGLDKSFQIGIFRLTPNIQLNFIDDNLVDYEYGVSPNQVAANRPEYSSGNALSLETGLVMFIEITSDWLVIARGSIEFLPDEIVDSPIVSKDILYKGFAAVNYVF